MARMKPYAVEVDGLHVLMVAASSKKEAADLIGTTLSMMTQWEGGMNDEDEALAMSSLGVVFRKKIVGHAEWQRPASGH